MFLMVRECKGMTRLLRPFRKRWAVGIVTSSSRKPVCILPYGHWRQRGATRRVQYVRMQLRANKVAQDAVLVDMRGMA